MSHPKSKELQKLTDDEIRRQFDELDLNKNGLIEWGETLHALKSLGIPEVVGEKRWQNAMVKEFGREKAHLTYEVRQCSKM
jgi:Ca2+-binding EF-hand superfamily protein